MFIHDNVIHRTVGPSLKLSGTGHSIINNLAVVALFPDTYRTPIEPFNAEWAANFDLVEAQDFSLIDNAAAGGRLKCLLPVATYADNLSVCFCYFYFGLGFHSVQVTLGMLY